jgi:RND superfamily putative drug exporter
LIARLGAPDYTSGLRLWGESRPNLHSHRDLPALILSQEYKLLAAHLITRHWAWILVGWLLIAFGLYWFAPSWDSVARDGDFEFLPATLPSRVGQKLLDEAFPAQRARSRLVIIVQREGAELTNADLAVTYDLGRRLMQIGAENMASRTSDQDEDGWKQVKSLLDIAIQLDGQWFDAVRSLAPDDALLLNQRLARAYADRAIVLDKLQQAEPASIDHDKAMLLQQESYLGRSTDSTATPAAPWSSVIDVWTWDDPVLGSKLGAGHPNARLIVLQLDSEFMAVGNVKLMEAVERLVEDVKKLHRPLWQEGLAIGISGPPAVGADMLRAAKAGVEQTEWISMALVLILLATIYRGPFLVCIPLITILLSLSVALSLIAIFSQPIDNRGSWFGFLQVFTTTKILLVVLLFGMGTDFCLFFVARCREGLIDGRNDRRRAAQRVVASSWVGVHDALVGSALTTSVGLLLMYFSDFEKFRYNGLVIGLAILVMLLVSLSFTPALLCGLGHYAFWPMRRPQALPEKSQRPAIPSLASRFWASLAQQIIRRPRVILFGCLFVLGIPALQGLLHRSWVTYDFLKELSWSAPSREGARLIDTYFSTRDNSPITVVLVSKEPFTEAVMREAINQVRIGLYLDGVTAVRTLTDPLGDYPPDRRMGLFSSDAWKRRMLENHRLTQTHYVALQDRLAQRAARFDVLSSLDPFAAEAEGLLTRIQQQLEKETCNPESPWYQATFACTGTTAGIADLKKITQRDQVRIQVLVTLGVWVVLFLLLRRPWFSAYLMFTVLLSYLTTLGLTQWFFWWAYGDDFVGLDWKVPLLLFVILVAVGQDYNVYLATRVFEEQAKHGPIQGLFRAMVTTGGIITSCGLVMAATFLSMAGSGLSAWLGELGVPWWLGGNEEALVLRGIVELGFALGLGVLIDTLLVRTILVPAMFVWLTRLQRG